MIGIIIKTAYTLTQESKFNPDSQQGAKTKIRTKTNHPHIHPFIRVHNKKGTLINKLYKTSPIHPRPPNTSRTPHTYHTQIHFAFFAQRLLRLETRDSKTQGRLKTPRYPLNFSPHVSHATIIHFVSSPANSPTARSGFSRDKEKGGRKREKKGRGDYKQSQPPHPNTQHEEKKKIMLHVAIIGYPDGCIPTHCTA